MKRCYVCKRFVWPWQNKYLGMTPAHAICDSMAFWRNAVEIVGVDAALDQARLRDLHAYTRPIV